MPKKKKTRKQKITADMRHKVVVEGPKSEYKAPPRLDRDQQAPVQAVVVNRYQYVYKDLFKTVILTLSIIACELVLGHLFA